MPELLQKAYRDQLITWIGKPCHFRLLYKISRDGCSAQAFYQQCDDQGPTVTVLYITNNTIYGGFLSQSWNSSGLYINDLKAFLFRLQYNGSSNPLKFPIKDESKAGFGSNSCGPTFGVGHDICTFSGTITNSGNEFFLNGSVNKIGMSYNLNGLNVNSITNNNLKVTDMEVYRIVVKKSTDPGENIQSGQLRHASTNETLINFKPMPETNVTATNILLIGQIGAGKSSFFNSVDSIFRGNVTSKACSGNSEHSVTRTYRKYEVKDVSRKTILKFRLCDTCGFQEGFALDSQEFSFIICGNLPDCYRFYPLVPFESDTPGYVKHLSLADKIHCVAFVIDGSTLDVMSDTVLKHMKDLQARMNHRGLPHVVLLTKVDKICPEVDDDVTNTYTSTAICEAVNKVAVIMGIPRAHVFPVKNYENETNLKLTLDILIMDALKRSLDFSNDFIDEQLHKLATEEKRYNTRDKVNQMKVS